MSIIDIRIKGTEYDIELLKKVLRTYIKQCKSKKEIIVCEDYIKLIDNAKAMTRGVVQRKYDGSSTLPTYANALVWGGILA